MRRFRTRPRLAAVILSVLGTTSVVNASEDLPMCRSWTQGPCALDVSASLLREDSGEPIAGRLLRFVASGRTLCLAVTDGRGHAACNAILSEGGSVLRSGWDVEFAGDGELSATTTEPSFTVAPKPTDPRFDGPAWSPSQAYAPRVRRGFASR